MSVFAVRRVSPDEWQRLRDLRVEALTLHPSAFSRDLEAEESLSARQWRARITAAPWLVCEDAGDWAGMAACRRDHGPKTGHLASLGAMYVRAFYRGRGVGDRLIEAVIAAASAEGVSFLELAVNAENAPAIALYERHGFRAYGRKPNAILVGGRYYDEIEMMRAV